MSVHAALRYWFAVPGRRVDLSELPGILRAVWVQEGYRDEAQQTAAFRAAVEWLEGYCSTLDDCAEPIGVERTVAARTEVLALSGRIDRIDQRGAELVIVDYKTGRSPSTADDARGSLALALYAYAAERVFRRRCRRVELHHLPSGTVAAHEHTDQSLARHLRRAEGIAQDAMAAQEALAGGVPPDEAFPAVAGGLCAWCDYRRACPAGGNAPAREPWSALDPRLLADPAPVSPAAAVPLSRPAEPDSAGRLPRR